MIDIRLTIALPSYGPQDGRVADSLASLEVALAKSGLSYEKIRIEQCPYFSFAMNLMIGLFLSRPREHGKRDRILFLDNDIVFRTEHAIKIAVSELDCVGGDYAMKTDDGGRTAILNGAVEAGHLGVSSMGTGFLAMSRPLLERMAERSQSFDVNGMRAPWLFRDEVVDGKFLGSDVVFFRELHAAGGSAWIDTSVRLGHIGARVYE